MTQRQQPSTSPPVQLRPNAALGAYSGALGSHVAARPQDADLLSQGKLRLLIVDADQPVLRACGEIATGMGFEVLTADSAGRARDLMRLHAPDVVLMDLKLSAGGLSLLEEIRKERPRCSVVVMTAFATVTSAVEAIRLGAVDYLTKPFAMDELTGVLERAAQRRTLEVETKRIQEQMKTQQEPFLIGSSAEVQKLLRIVQKVATASHPVLVVGESGTGKEAVARAIHAAGPHAGKRCEMLDCRQLSPAVLEGELFGYVRNASTGESRVKVGALTVEGGGTLFLNGIGSLPAEMQARLLRALQDRKVRPAGADQAVPVTVRLLAGSDRDLSTLVTQGQFRKDLYYRLNVVMLRIPPLRERGGDIPLLAEVFLGRMWREGGVNYQLAPDAIDALVTYSWPENVSELERCIESACTKSSGPNLHLGDLPPEIQGAATAASVSSGVLRVDARQYQDPVSGRSQEDRRAPAAIVSIAELERDAILHTIRQLKGDKLMAAKLLGIGKTTLYRKLKEYGISD